MPREKKSSRPAILVHGGAGRFFYSKPREERARDSLRRVVSEAYERLSKDGAKEAVIWAVAQLEDDPQFDAGTGGRLQRDGRVRLSAALMDGFTRRFSGVINIEQVKNPIHVAACLQELKDRVLAGLPAQNFARKAGFENYNPITEEQWTRWREKSATIAQDEMSDRIGTVGAVAVDVEGRLAAATSTGGRGMEIEGRVSDTATVAGTYASSSAAVSTSGVGEELVEWALAARIVTRVDDGGSLEKVFQNTLREFKAMGGRGGGIGVDRTGRVTVGTTTDCIFYAGRTAERIFGYP